MTMRNRSCWWPQKLATGNLAPSAISGFRDVIVLARDTGMRNGRELYRIRTENLDWNNRITFVADSKTADGRRMIPMSDRV
jgi:integrase